MSHGARNCRHLELWARGRGLEEGYLVAWVRGVGVTSWKPLLLLATLLRAQVLLRAPTLVTVRGALIVAPVLV